MSLEAGLAPTVRSNRPVLRELAVVVAVLLGLALWQRIVAELVAATSSAFPAFEDVLVRGLLTGTLFVAGLALFVGVYVRARGLEVGLRTPSRGDLPLIGVAALAPAVLVGLTKVVGLLTGVPYNTFTMTTYASGASLSLAAVLTGLSLLVAVPTLLLLCQVVVQGSLRAVAGSDAAVLLTTALTGFLVTSNTGGYATIPERGRLLGALAFVLVLGVALYGTETFDRAWLRTLAAVPALALVALVVLAGVAEVGTIAGGLFALTHVLVLGLAAYTYDRSDSLLVPALAYVSLLLSSEVVVFGLEAGIQGW